LKKLRRASTDRPPLGMADVLHLRQWRTELLSVIKEPSAWGLPSATEIHPSLILAADETPLVYIPRSKGTYGTGRTTFIVGEGDKRQVTCTPICAMDNTCPLLQIIWRGKSLRCTPRGTPPVPGALQLYHDFAEKKCQTRHTWGNLLSRVQVYLMNKRIELGLPQTAPSLFIVDNVASHAKDGLIRTGPSEHLWASPEHPGLYFMFGLPNLSHCCNPGDQAINLSLRQTVRRATKLRAVHHYLQVPLLPSDHYFLFSFFSAGLPRPVTSAESP
jgi:hypothetical protein